MEAGGAEVTASAAERSPRRRSGGVNANALAALACALLAACFVVPYLPPFRADELVKTSLWALATVASSAGWGTLVAQRCWPNVRVSLSLRSVWGASLFAFVGGTGALFSGLSRPLLLGWLVAGGVLLGRSWVVQRESLARDVHARLRATRLNLPLAAVVFFLAAAVLVHFLGGASDTSSNPFDDDIAYYPFAKQLLERGTLLDPFNFRRMSTLGGQALYHAALLLRVQVLHLNVFDRGICVLVTAGLLASHRMNGRKVPILARLVSVAFLVVLPNTSINSASYYSGVAFFLAFYQTLELLPPDTFVPFRPTVARLVPLALVGAALCTLRQNYQATVGLVLVVSYGLAAVRLRKRALRPVLVEGVLCLVLVGVFVLPWLALLYRSSDTFLFPVMKGTFRAGVSVQSEYMTEMRFVRFFADVWLHPEPIQTLPIFFLVGLLVRDGSARRPLASQWLAAFASIVMLSRAFSLSDAANLARYDYGFVTASALLTWHHVAAQAATRQRGGGLGWAAPVALLVFALSAPLVERTNAERGQKMIAARLRDTDELSRRSVPMQVEPPIALTYRRLQASIPSGARMLVLLDEPYLLDYSRNEIWNLDMPGSASPKPEMPCFQGPEPLADYLVALGIRHLAFVFPKQSRFLYTRELWFERLWGPEEIWRVYAPYIIDVTDNLVALASTRARLHEEDGMVVIDLQQRR